MNEPELPVLPKPKHIDDIGLSRSYAYTSEDMRSYALSAVLMEREKMAHFCDAMHGMGGGRGWNQAVAFIAAAIRSPSKEG